MRPELRDENGKRLKNSGHYLSEEQLAKALESLKEPVMVLKGSLANTFVAVTDFKDDKDKEIIIAIEFTYSKNDWRFSDNKRSACKLSIAVNQTVQVFSEQ